MVYKNIGQPYRDYMYEYIKAYISLAVLMDSHLGESPHRGNILTWDSPMGVPPSLMVDSPHGEFPLPLGGSPLGFAHRGFPYGGFPRPVALD